MKKTNLLILCAASAAILTAWITPARGGEVDEKRIAKLEAERKKAAAEQPDQPQSGALKMYEWGVQRDNWDGTPVVINDVPDFYYDASEVPIADAPVTDPEPEPDPEPHRGMEEKPVIYFEASEGMGFGFDVKFTVGDITWMYPKPSRRTDASTAQWDSITVFPDGGDLDKGLPELHSVAKGHWSEFSREGSTSTLSVNGEAERFLFYEGTNSDLPEVDVSQDAEGNIILRNYSCCAVHDLRLRVKVKDAWRAWYVRAIAEANGDTPRELKLSDGDAVKLDDTRKPGLLAAEAKAAGLTDSQSKVFERCWGESFLQEEKAVLTYRLDQVLLDENYILTVKAPGVTVESKRVGYKYVAGIDLSRQDDLDALTLLAAGGDKEATAKLTKSGISGVGAVRRAMLDKDQPLRKRVNLAQILKAMAGGGH
ncbi:MAG: hypothetical protein IT462_15545 [Planctomycetes bacterium]|nr:hypothetical protein [Planctomycetota bacterium]